MFSVAIKECPDQKDKLGKSEIYLLPHNSSPSKFFPKRSHVGQGYFGNFVVLVDVVML